jgi:hypothetical protein
MDFLVNASRVFVPRNAAKLLVGIDDEEVKIKVDAGIFEEDDEVLIDAETITIGTVDSTGEGWTIYNATRGGSPTEHAANANVLGPSPAELISYAFNGTTEFSEIFLDGDTEGIFCYQVGENRLKYWQTTWATLTLIIPFKPTNVSAATRKILVWSQQPSVFGASFV